MLLTGFAYEIEDPRDRSRSIGERFSFHRSRFSFSSIERVFHSMFRLEFPMKNNYRIEGRACVTTQAPRASAPRTRREHAQVGCARLRPMLRPHR